MSHRFPPARAIATAAAVVVALAGCTPAGPGVGASPTATAAPTATVAARAPEGTVDPCALLAADFIKEVSGFGMLEGEFDASLSNSSRNICNWGPASDERNVPRVQVVVNWELADAAEHRALAEEIFGPLKNLEIEGATDAYAYPGYRTEAMQVGDLFVKVSYTHPNRGDAGSITTALATEVVRNLG